MLTGLRSRDPATENLSRITCIWNYTRAQECSPCTKCNHLFLRLLPGPHHCSQSPPLLLGFITLGRRGPALGPTPSPNSSPPPACAPGCCLLRRSHIAGRTEVLPARGGDEARLKTIPMNICTLLSHRQGSSHKCPLRKPKVRPVMGFQAGWPARKQANEDHSGDAAVKFTCLRPFQAWQVLRSRLGEWARRLAFPGVPPQSLVSPAARMPYKLSKALGEKGMPGSQARVLPAERPRTTHDQRSSPPQSPSSPPSPFRCG